MNTESFPSWWYLLSLCLFLSESCSQMKLVLGQFWQRVSLSRLLPANGFHCYKLICQWQKFLRWWTFSNFLSPDTPLLQSAHDAESSEVSQSDFYHGIFIFIIFMIESQGIKCTDELHLMWMWNLLTEVGYFERGRESYFYFESGPADIDKTIPNKPGHTENNQRGDEQVIRQSPVGALSLSCIYRLALLSLL